MRRFILSLILIALVFYSNSQDVRVRGYIRKNGTYVSPHYRTRPNSTNKDNYSTKGNYNPYTGKEGTVNPDANDVYYYNYYYNTYSYYNYFKSLTYKQQSFVVGRLGAKKDYKSKKRNFFIPFFSSVIYGPLGIPAVIGCNIFRGKINGSGHKYYGDTYNPNNIYYQEGYKRRAKAKIFWKSMAGVSLGLLTRGSIKLFLNTR